MQLCKCLNYFFKAHNKQLKQYCLNFIIFFNQKKGFKKWFESQVGLGWPAKKGLGWPAKKGLGHGSTCFCFMSKKSDSGRVFSRLGQKILICFAMSNKEHAI